MGIGVDKARGRAVDPRSRRLRRAGGKYENATRAPVFLAGGVRRGDFDDAVADAIQSAFRAVGALEVLAKAGPQGGEAESIAKAIEKVLPRIEAALAAGERAQEMLTA